MKKRIFTFLLLGLGWLVGYGMRPVEAQWSYVANSMPPLSSDGTNILLASGQLLLPDGTAALPSWGWTSDADGTSETGMYRSAANRITASINGNPTMTLLSLGLYMNLTGSAGLPSVANDPDSNTGLFWTGTDALGITAGGAQVLLAAKTNAAGTGADLVTISSIPGAMDSSGDIVNFLLIDANGTPNHSDGNVFGLNFDLQAADAQAIEAMIHGNDTWDYFIDADSAVGTPSWITNSDKDGNTAGGTIKVWIGGVLWHIQLYADS